jgi:hypothetical protein
VRERRGERGTERERDAWEHKEEKMIRVQEKKRRRRGRVERGVM